MGTTMVGINVPPILQEQKHHQNTSAIVG